MSADITYMPKTLFMARRRDTIYIYMQQQHDAEEGRGTFSEGGRIEPKSICHVCLTKGFTTEPLVQRRLGSPG